MSINSFVQITNATGVVFNPTAAVPPALVTKQQDLSGYDIQRIFAAADIGDAIYQTQDNTDPTVGCLVAQVQGSTLNMILSATVYIPMTTAGGTVIFAPLQSSLVGDLVIHPFYGVYAVQSPLHDNMVNIFIWDQGTAAGAQIVAGSYVNIHVGLGNP